MPIIVKVLEKDSAIAGDTLTLGFPDESGQQVQLTVQDEDLDALRTGQQYTLAFVPFSTAGSPIAVPLPGVAAPADTPVPTEHPAVIDPTAAAAATPADAGGDSSAADPGSSPGGPSGG